MAEQNLAELISMLRCRCEKTEEEIRKHTPLTPSEYRALSKIDAGERITSAEFSYRMGLSPSRGSRVIEKLCENNYVVSERCDTDKRCLILRVGENGLRIKKNIAESFNECNKKITQKLSDSEIQAIRKSIESLMKVLE